MWFHVNVVIIEHKPEAVRLIRGTRFLCARLIKQTYSHKPICRASALQDSPEFWVDKQFHV